jgi:hypothetical protein
MSQGGCYPSNSAAATSTPFYGLWRVDCGWDLVVVAVCSRVDGVSEPTDRPTNQNEAEAETSEPVDVGLFFTYGAYGQSFLLCVESHLPNGVEQVVLRVKKNRTCCAFCGFSRRRLDACVFACCSCSSFSHSPPAQNAAPSNPMPSPLVAHQRTFTIRRSEHRETMVGCVHEWMCSHSHVTHVENLKPKSKTNAMDVGLQDGLRLWH